ncbi:MAG: hypothetical protein IJT12_07205 [Paludibacteraceae bacterium]|nr:hypothetical protein [Paludibacteraceae bacterium]
MKTINKYLFLLAAVVFGLTACEEQQKREPSPVANPSAIAFKQSSVSAEINPGKVALEYKLALVRTSTDSAVTAVIEVVEGDIDIINVPASVTFAKGEAEAELLLTFPNAEIDSTYSITLAIDSLSQSPYLSGSTTCTFTAIIAAWENAEKPAVFLDAVVSSPYGVTPLPFYVAYKEKVNVDGSKDYRFLNPYNNLDPEAEADQFGVYSVFPYNEKESEVDLDNDYHWEMHVDVDGKVTFGKVPFGINYGDGLVNAWMAADFWAKRNETEPDYETYGAGIYDAATKTITLPAGVMLWYLDGYGGNYTSMDHVIYLDSKAYQDDHLSIADYNDPTIEWVEQESVVNQFESTIFKFKNEDQKLFKAVDQYEGNPKSPFIDLYCLKDVYAEGGNLAFYWNGEKEDTLDIPVPQNTKISFMGKELFIQEAEGVVTTNQLKGTDVSVFTFNITVVSKSGDLVGTFVETFSIADEAIIFEKEDFLGNFTLDGYSPFNGSAMSQTIEIKEDGEDIIILGVTRADTIWADFDAETGFLSIAPQYLPNTFPYGDTVYSTLLVTFDEDFDISTKAPLIFGYNLSGECLLQDTQIGYLIQAEGLGNLAGCFDLSLARVEVATPAPAKVSVSNCIYNNTEIQKQGLRVNAHKPSVSDLSFQGKYRRTAKATTL